MPKKRYDLPPIDLTSPDNEDWVGKVLERHPEIISGGMYKLTQNDIQRKELTVISKPGKPKNINKKIDWEAWFLYYNLSILAGFQESYESIGNLIPRSAITVKQKFIEIGKQLN